MAEGSKYDVAIIGGGLAGLSLAIQSAKAGYKVVLFEKEVYPFHKVCGEYISLESQPFLEQLGVPVHDMSLPVIQRLQISDVKGNIFDFDLPLGGFGISRYSLDNLLYKSAKAAGAEVVTDTKVTDVIFKKDEFEIKTSAGKYNATVVAGCFGKKSNIDVKLKRRFLKQRPNALNNYIGVKYHVRFPNASDTIALHNFLDGYCGISSVEDGKSCLCYLTTEANLKQNNNSLKEMEKQVLFQNPVLQNIFKNAEFLYDKPLTISKVNFNKKPQVENHILMIGDAAGMITPLCGNGMSMALHGSKFAFNAVCLFLQKKIDRRQMEQQYASDWQKQFSKRLWTGRMVQRMAGGNTSTSLLLKTMHSIPSLADVIIKSTHGDIF